MRVEEKDGRLHVSRTNHRWAHLYSIIAFTLVALNFVVSYLLMSRWYLGAAPTPTSPQVRRLALIYGALDGMAVLFSALAIWREHPKRLAYIALFASLVASVLCGASFSE